VPDYSDITADDYLANYCPTVAYSRGFLAGYKRAVEDMQALFKIKEAA